MPKKIKTEEQKAYELLEKIYLSINPYSSEKRITEGLYKQLLNYFEVDVEKDFADALVVVLNGNA